MFGSKGQGTNCLLVGRKGKLIQKFVDNYFEIYPDIVEGCTKEQSISDLVMQTGDVGDQELKGQIGRAMNMDWEAVDLVLKGFNPDTMQKVVR